MTEIVSDLWEACGENYAETARQLGIHEALVRRIVIKGQIPAGRNLAKMLDNMGGPAAFFQLHPAVRIMGESDPIGREFDRIMGPDRRKQALLPTRRLVKRLGPDAVVKLLEGLAEALDREPPRKK